jgi:hypothetical protein
MTGFVSDSVRAGDIRLGHALRVSRLVLPVIAK